MKKHWLLLILIVAIFLLLCWSLWWSNYGLKTVRYTVGGMSLPEGFNGYHIVQLSDLHSVSLGEENGRLLKAIRAEEPDIIVMTGDMVSRYDGAVHWRRNIRSTISVGTMRKDWPPPTGKATVLRWQHPEYKYWIMKRCSLRRKTATEST